ncbi:MAG TPA: MBG domain-containing protein, partial [Phycisphaerae bacterium]|nr:MBG domain-containing protein [Phycisphaerae bacterium]
DTVTSLAETYDTQNTGTGKTLSVSAYTVNDNNAGANYIVSTVANTTGVINAATLTVTANNQSKMCGMPNPSLTASYAGFVGGENIGVLTSPVTLSTTATTSSGAGTYPITSGGAAAANYTMNYVNGMLTVILSTQLSCTSVNIGGINQIIVSWPTILGQTYQLEYTYSLPAASWTPMGSSVSGTGLPMAVTNSADIAPQCFYRVMVQ